MALDLIQYSKLNHEEQLWQTECSDRFWNQIAVSTRDR